MSGLSDAAAALSERIAAEGGGLQPEFSVEDAGASEETETAEAGAEVEQEAELEAGAEEQGNEERIELPASVNELAELLGVDESALYGLTLNVSLGNESKSLTLEQLKDAATGPIRDEAERTRWNDQRRAQEAEIKAQKDALDARRRDADMLASIVFQGHVQREQQLAQAYQALLRNVEYQGRDPQGYQVELMRHQAALQDVQQQKEGLRTQMDQLRQQMAAEEQQRVEQAEVSGRKRLRELVPEWADDGGFETGATELRQYVMQERFGTTEEELAKTLDPRILYWAEMARRYERLQEQAKQPPKAAARPKLVPGAQQVKLPRGRRAEMDAMDRLGKSGSIDDARAALKARLGQL